LVELSQQLVEQQSPNEIVETRLLIECECARLCALRATPEICQKLDALLEHYREARGDGDTLEKMNTDLHNTIAIGAQNKALLKIMSDIWALMMRICGISLKIRPTTVLLWWKNTFANMLKLWKR
jgi:DNA-binding FadR family transcriptional regulator